MKAEVNVPRTWAYVVLVALLLGSGMFAFAMAYNANYGTTPNPASNAITFGHSPDEIEVDLGTGTAPCTGKVTLQFAIANKCLGGGGSGGSASDSTVGSYFATASAQGTVLLNQAKLQQLCGNGYGCTMTLGYKY